MIDLKKTVLFFFILFSFLSFPQKITVIRKNSTETIAYLYSLRGETVDLVDSVKTSSPGIFSFGGSDLHPGFYRLKFQQTGGLDFVFDRENVEMIVDEKISPDSIDVIQSESNRLYLEFIRLTKNYKIKSELLRLVLHSYPEKDSYYNLTLKELDRLQEDYLFFVNVTAQKNEDLFIAKYIRSAGLPVIPVNIPRDSSLAYLKTHALDNINFYSKELIYSDLFSSRTIEYLTYFRNPRLPLELLEKEFNKAIDSILNRAKVNEVVYSHIVEYLIEGFKKFGFENVLDYIVNNYVIKDGLCLDEKVGSSTQRMINQNKFLAVGTIAPNISLPGLTGEITDLSKIDGRVLLIFYSSKCPHCKTLLPEINSISDELKKKRITALAVSLDTDKEEWTKFAEIYSPDLINLSDLNGWESKVALDYFIYATPSMFFIGDDGKIIAKPTTLASFRKFLTP